MSESFAESLQDNQSTEYTLNGLIVFSIVTLILSITSIVLRFWSRLALPRASVGYVTLYALDYLIVNTNETLKVR